MATCIQSVKTFILCAKETTKKKKNISQNFNTNKNKNEVPLE